MKQRSISSKAKLILLVLNFLKINVPRLRCNRNGPPQHIFMCENNDLR